MRQHDVFMFYLFMFFNLLYTLSEKKSGFGFEKFEGLALNVANCLKRSKMPRCSDWLQPERYRKMQFYIL